MTTAFIPIVLNPKLNRLLFSLCVLQFVGVLGCGNQSGRRGLERPVIPVKYPPPAKVVPVHGLTLAILPIKDTRQTSEGTDSAHRYTYRGKSYRFTDLRRLKRGLSDELSGHLAQVFLRQSIFRKIILVNDLSDAADAELILTAEVKRARGYIEDLEIAKSNAKANINTSTSSRQVLSEFVLENVQVRKGNSKQLLFDSDFGWSVFETRAIAEDAVSRGAFDVLADTVGHVLNQLALALKISDLSGAVTIKKEVMMLEVHSGGPMLDGLDKALPEGWGMTNTSSLSVPLGWRGSSSTCQNARLEAAQSWKFHRAIGPYRPTLDIWACNATVGLEYLHSSSKNAEYLGKRIDGTNYFVLGRGETNWKRYRRDLRKLFGVTEPTQRHVFRIKPAGSSN